MIINNYYMPQNKNQSGSNEFNKISANLCVLNCTQFRLNEIIIHYCSFLVVLPIFTLVQNFEGTERIGLQGDMPQWPRPPPHSCAERSHESSVTHVEGRGENQPLARTSPGAQAPGLQSVHLNCFTVRVHSQCNWKTKKLLKSILKFL